MFGGGGGTQAPPPQPVPQVTDPNIQLQRAQERALARKRGGRAATLLRGTGARLGDTGAATPPSPMAELLGVSSGATGGGGDGL